MVAPRCSNKTKAAEAEEIDQLSADDTYDRCRVYDAVNERHIRRAAVPLRKGARIWQHGANSKEWLIRDENLRAVRKKGRKRWKQEAAYHRRS